jgi:uncharacterized membrane protein YhaH (DUF805 family)
MNNAILNLEEKFMIIRKNYFSFKGRISPRTYGNRQIRYSLAESILMFLTTALLTIIFHGNIGGTMILALETAVFTTVEMLCQASLNTRRLHDFNKNGWVQLPFLSAGIIFEVIGVLKECTSNLIAERVIQFSYLLKISYFVFVCFLVWKKGDFLANCYKNVGKEE